MEKKYSSVELNITKVKFAELYRKAMIYNAECKLKVIAQYAYPGEPYPEETLELMARHVEACNILIPYVAGKTALEQDYLDLGAVWDTYDYLLKHNGQRIDVRDPKVELVNIICDFHKRSDH